MQVNVKGGTLPQSEIDQYVKHATEACGFPPDALDITVEGDEVLLGYHVPASPFERIRRITGYLTGSTSSWNNAKRAEERDRVKHGLSAGASGKE